MRILILFFCCGMLTLSTFVHGQPVIPLYDGEIPNSRPGDMTETSTTDNIGITRVTGVSVPTLTVYLPEKKTEFDGTAVVICPGGAYTILAIDHEGHEVARLLAANGIAAFVLKYRLPKDEIMADKRIGPLQDAQRAIQLVRERAAEWGIDPDRIGIAGFSAGGHLASTASTHFDHVLIPNPKGTSLRPDFSLLIYPVISMADSITHKGSQTNLLGEQPSAEDKIRFSNDRQVKASTPPAFVVHATDDTAVPIANSEAYVSALKSVGVDATLLTYPQGGHGFGLNNRTTADRWFDHFLEWLRVHAKR